MKTALTFLLAVALVGPAPDKAQKVDDVKALYHHHISKWGWACIGAVAATGTILALRESRPPLRHGQGRGFLFQVRVK